VRLLQREWVVGTEASLERLIGSTIDLQRLLEAAQEPEVSTEELFGFERTLMIGPESFAQRVSGVLVQLIGAVEIGEQA
jgi:hypothetical protein